MMDLPMAAGDSVEAVKKDNEACYITTGRGVLRLSFVKEGIVRVVFSIDGDFGKKQPWIMDYVDDVQADLSEDDEYVCVSLNNLVVKVTKSTSQVSFWKDTEGVLTPVFTEETYRQYEPVTEYLTVDDGSVVSEDVVTADGVKKVVTSSKKVAGRTLYRSRLPLKFDGGEALYGLGQSDEGVLNLRGHVRYLHQANRKISIPVLMSSKGYGLFFPSGSAGIFSDTEDGTYFQTESSKTIEYYFLGGESLDESVSMYRYLTGKAVMLPTWAYGYLQSKERYESQAELLSLADEFRNKDIGIDGLILDWLTWEDNMWGQKTLDPVRFPNPDEMMEKLHEKDIHLLISIWPNMTEACDNHKEFKEQKLLYPGTEIYDALSKEGRELYWKQVYEGIYCHGFDGFWCDSSEPFTPEWTKPMRPDVASAYRDYIEVAKASMPYDEINAYGFYHALGIYEGQHKLTDTPVFNLTRNGYAGSQRLGTVLWSGDISASFDTLKKQVAEGLNFCASGLPYWTLDIGAFFVKRGAPWFWDGKYPDALNDPGYRELYVRWYQYGAFLPIFRSHGTDCPREPWRFGKPGDMFYDAIIKANELRYRLMPYILNVARMVYEEDYTMMRLLAFDFSEDERVKNISDQYMFGPSLMVCPVLFPMYYDCDSKPVDVHKEREVYFPKGTNWVDIRDGKKYSGGETVKVPADISGIPVFAKEGSVIPMCEGLKSTRDIESARIVNSSYV